MLFMENTYVLDEKHPCFWGTVAEQRETFLLNPENAFCIHENC